MESQDSSTKFARVRSGSTYDTKESNDSVFRTNETTLPQFSIKSKYPTKTQTFPSWLVNNVLREHRTAEKFQQKFKRVRWILNEQR